MRIDFNADPNEPALSTDERREFDDFTRATTEGNVLPSNHLVGYWVSSLMHIDLHEFAFAQTESKWKLEAASGRLEGHGTEEMASGAREAVSFEGEFDERGLIRGYKTYARGGRALQCFVPYVLSGDPTSGRALRLPFLGRREGSIVAGRFVVINPDDGSRLDGALFFVPKNEAESFTSELGDVFLSAKLVHEGSHSISLSMEAAHNELIARLGEGEPPPTYAQRWPVAAESYDSQHWEYLTSVDAFFRGTDERAPEYGPSTRWALRAVLYDYLFISPRR